MLTLTCQNHDDDAREIANLTTDAQKFVQAFGGTISESTPHIYVSALPFSPERSLILKHFSGKFPQTLHVCTGRTSNWEATQIVVRKHTDAVSSVAFSQDGKCIISGSVDKTVHVWDAETGEAVHTPLQGHTDMVYSIAFSQDGKCIVSGSHDKTIRVWDAETGEAVHTPLQGHTSGVSSIAFSQDGKHIISGSYDNTVHVWDAETGEAMHTPLQGHMSSVSSVASS